MPIESRIQLKTYFETGDIPTEDQFINVLDSYFHLEDGNIGDIILTGSIDVSGSINATGTASFGFITSSLPLGIDNTVVILDNDNIFRQREIDSRVWGSTLLDGNNLTAFNVPQVQDFNTLRDSVIFSDQNDQIGINTGYLVAQPATLTVEGTISASGDLSAADITSSNNISASKTISGSDFWGENFNFTGHGTASIISASKHISASNMGAHSGHFHHITASVDDSTKGNISASGYVSASGMDLSEGNITNAGIVYLDNITADNANINIHALDYLFLTGSFVTDNSISASGFVSASNVGAAIGTITNITSSNVSASGYVSASNIGALIGTITNITSSNISASGYVSASNVGADTGSMEIINLGNKLQHTGNTSTALNFTTFRAILGAGLAQIDISGSDDTALTNQIRINNNFADTDFIIYASSSAVLLNRPSFRATAKSGSVLIGGASFTNHTLLGVNGNLYLEGTNGNITASQNISASGTIYGSAGDFAEGDITNVGAIYADVLAADNGTILNIIADNTFVTGALTIENNVSGSRDFFGRDAYFRNITASNDISASGTITGASSSFDHIDAVTGSFGHINVKGKISHTGDQANSIDFTTQRMIMGVGRSQIDISGSIDPLARGEIRHNNAFFNVDTLIFGESGGGSGSFNPIFKTHAVSHSISIGSSSPLGAGTTLYPAPKLGVYGGISTDGLDGHIVATGDISSSRTSSAEYGFVERDFLTSKILIGQHFIGDQALGGAIPSASQDNGTARLFISGNNSNNALIRVMDSDSVEILFISGGVGMGTITPGEKLEVIGNISASGNLTVTNVTASSNVSASKAIYMSQSAGLDNSVVVLQGSDNKLVTDEIDPKVWAQKLVDYTGTPLNNQIAIFTDIDTVEGDAELTYDGTQLSVDGNISASGFVSASNVGASIGTFTNITASNVSASGYVSASNIGALIGTFTNVTASNILATGNGQFTTLNSLGAFFMNITASQNVTVPYGYVSASSLGAYVSITAPNITASNNISASGYVSASNVGALIGTFTNITASNVSASGYVSASNVGASSIIGTNITASQNIIATGGTSYISASMIGGTTSVTGFSITSSTDISASRTGSFGHIDIDVINAVSASMTFLTGSSITSSFTGSLLGTASWSSGSTVAVTATSASHAISSSVAWISTTAHTASHAVTASHAITTITASHALITSNNPTNFKNTGRRIGNSAISGNLYITGGQGLLGNVATFGDVTASGRLILGNSTEIYSGSMNGPNVIILHTTGGLTNFFAGAYAGASNVVEGEQNIGIGYEAANSLSTGDENTWIGYQAGKDSTVGDRNVAIGRSALENNVSGDGNIAIGYKAGENETGDNKLYIGNDANPVLIKGDMAIDEVKVYGLLTATHSISSSGHLFASNSLDTTSVGVFPVVVWDSGSGRFYHTGSYGGGTGGGGGAADHLGNHSASLNLFMNSQSINDVNNITFHSSSTIHINHIGFSSSVHSNTLEFRDKIQNTIISGSIIKEKKIGYSNYIPPNYKLGIGLNGSPTSPIANIHVKGDIWASGSNGNVTASGIISASGKMVAATASFGTNPTNTTNISGTPLYVHGKISASSEIEGLDVVAQRKISSSLHLMSLSASFGTATSNTTNPTDGGIQNVLYAHGNISSSQDIVAHNFTSSGHYNLVTTNTKGSGSIHQSGTRVFHTMAGSVFLGKNAGNFNLGTPNVGIGQKSLAQANPDIGHNTAVGYQSGYQIQHSNYNTILGSQAFKSAVNDSKSNIVIGYNSLPQFETGEYNTMIGHVAGEPLNRTNYNIGIGYRVFTGSQSNSDTVIENCIAIGKKAGISNATSSKLFLGNSFTGLGADSAAFQHHLIEGEMDLGLNTSGSGRVTIQQILRIFPTGSSTIAVNDTTNPTNSFGEKHWRPGDLSVSGSGVDGTVHNLMFYNGIAWKKIV